MSCTGVAAAAAPAVVAVLAMAPRGTLSGPVAAVAAIAAVVALAAVGKSRERGPHGLLLLSRIRDHKTAEGLRTELRSRSMTNDCLCAGSSRSPLAQRSSSWWAVMNSSTCSDEGGGPTAICPSWGGACSEGTIGADGSVCCKGMAYSCELSPAGAAAIIPYEDSGPHAMLPGCM